VTFASFRQILTLIVLTAGLLFAIDRIKSPRPAGARSDRRADSVMADRPTIRLWLSGQCFGGCRTGLVEALSEVPWLEAPKVLENVPTPEAGNPAPGVVNADRPQVVVGIRDPDRNLKNVDFVTVLRALHKSGFAAAQMEFSGLPHYRLEAELPHMCSPACVEGTREAMDDLVRASKPQGSFRWLDSYNVDAVNQTLVIYPRLGATVDMLEVLAAINTIGFEASALTVQVHGAK
jgi:hypothetical protein